MPVYLHNGGFGAIIELLFTSASRVLSRNVPKTLNVLNYRERQQGGDVAQGLTCTLTVLLLPGAYG